MKRAVILHGTDGHPDHNWQPWLRSELEKRGFEVWNPELPDNHRPNRLTYENFLKKAGWDFKDNIIIGHSSGATTTLNLLMSDWFPKVKAAILVGTFLNEKLTSRLEGFEKGQFNNLFPSNGFDIEKIKSGAEHFYFIHGAKDGYCDPRDTEKLAHQVDGKFILVPDAGHFSSPTSSIPQIITALDDAYL